MSFQEMIKMLKDNQLTADLAIKVEMMRFFLKEFEKRERWHNHKETPPPQEGVTITKEGTQVRRTINGETLLRWQDEGVYLAEAYLYATSSFFDVLAKCLKKGWKPSERLHFNAWIDEVASKNATDEFVRLLKAFKDEKLSKLSEARNEAAHAQTLQRRMGPMGQIKFEKGKPLELHFLVTNLGGVKKDLLDHLKEFQAEFDHLLDEIDKNFEKDY